jgi:two-component system, chemotaxis family, CheB/CheR fusion protein
MAPYPMASAGSTFRGRSVVLAWAERQGPPVVPPQRKGLGTKLIQRGLPDATIDWRFEAEGVVCAIDLPLAKPKNGSATRVNL